MFQKLRVHPVCVLVFFNIIPHHPVNQSYWRITRSSYANITKTCGNQDCLLASGAVPPQPTNTRSNAGSLLGHRRRRWPNSEPALRQLLLLAVSCWLGWEWDEISSNVAGMRGNGLRDLLSRSSTVHDQRRLNDWLKVRLHSNTIIIYSQFILEQFQLFLHVGLYKKNTQKTFIC